MKTSIKLLIAAIILIITALLVAPAAARWYIEKHSMEWTGRRIVMSGLAFNYFTGGLTIKDLRVFESNSKEIFFQSPELYVNTEPWRAITGAYELTEINIDQPFIKILQDNEKFNFDDLVARFAATDTKTSKTTTSDPVKYWVRNIAINNGSIHYANKGIGNTILVKDLKASLPLLAWDNPNQQYKVELNIEQGGSIDAALDLNSISLAYTLQYRMNNLNLDILYPYLKDYLRVDEMKGAIDTDFVFYGNFNEPQAIAATGKTALRDLSITDPNKEPLITVGSFSVDVDSLNVKSNIYNVRNINLNKPYLKFERFENENNFSKLLDYASDDAGVTDSTSLAVESGNIFELIATYVHDLSENYAISNYRADSVAIRGGTLIFNDYTLNSKFNYLLEDLSVKAERLNSQNQNLTFLLSSTLNTSGRMKGQLLVDPKGFRDMQILYTVDDLKIADFNPYSDYYVAYPFEDGTCFYSNKSTIKNRFLESDNELHIKKIVVGKKRKNKTAVNLPIRLAVALLRDVNGDVNLDVPVTGNLDDPKYRLGPIVWQILKNLILKAVAAPGKLLAKRSGVDEKYLEGFEWQLLQRDMNEEQIRALDAAVKTLLVSPEMNLEFIKSYNYEKELDQLALEQSKKRFLFFKSRISSDDEISTDEERLVESLETKDSLFNAYVDQEIKAPAGTPLSVYDKSKKLVGTDKLKAKLLRLYDARSEAIRKYLVETKQVDVARFRIIETKENKEISYEGPSRTQMNFYLADYYNEVNDNEQSGKDAASPKR